MSGNGSDEDGGNGAAGENGDSDELELFDSFRDIDYEEVFSGTPLEGAAEEGESKAEYVGGRVGAYLGRSVGAWLGGLVVTALTDALEGTDEEEGEAEEAEEEGEDEDEEGEEGEGEESEEDEEGQDDEGEGEESEEDDEE